jgi:hypothetical protein
MSLPLYWYKYLYYTPYERIIPVQLGGDISETGLRVRRKQGLEK